MGDMATLFKEWREMKKARRDACGVNCPQCNVIQPKRIPTILLPGQKCRVCGYRDSRNPKDFP